MEKSAAMNTYVFLVQCDECDEYVHSYETIDAESREEALNALREETLLSCCHVLPVGFDSIEVLEDALLALRTDEAGIARRRAEYFAEINARADGGEQ